MAKKTIDDSNLGYLVSKIKSAFWPKADVVQISIDASPTANSTNLVTSGGVYNAIPSVSGKEDTANKVTSLSSSSTDTQYPSAKCVYDAIQAGGGGMNASVSGRVLTITGVTVNNRNLIL